MKNQGHKNMFDKMKNQLHKFPYLLYSVNSAASNMFLSVLFEIADALYTFMYLKEGHAYATSCFLADRPREEDDVGVGQAGPEDLMAHQGGPRWARLENENKTGNHMGFSGAQAELRWAVEKFLFKI
jgi:hypothetical protein